jgi:hypothetical protein
LHLGEQICDGRIVTGHNTSFVAGWLAMVCHSLGACPQLPSQAILHNGLRNKPPVR